MEDFHIEPLKKPRKRRNGDLSEDSQGQTVEYERGYLRAKIKAERGVLKSKKPKERAFEPPVDPSCGIEFLYVFELGTIPCAVTGDLTLDIWWRPAGQAGPLKPLTVNYDTTVPSPADQSLLKYLFRFRERITGTRGNRFIVPLNFQAGLITLLEEANQLRWSARASEPGQWRLHRMNYSGKCNWCVSWREDAPGQRQPQIWLEASQGDLDIAAWNSFSPAGWIIAGDSLHVIKIRNAVPKIAELCGRSTIVMNNREAQEFLELLVLDGNPVLREMNEENRCQVVSVPPRGRLYVTTARYKHLGQEQLQCNLSFDYDGVICDENSKEERLLGVRQVILRSSNDEETLKARLLALGFRNVTRTGGDEDPGWKLLPAKLDAAVRSLVLEGWEISAEGKNYKRPVEKSFGVAASGIDWLELRASVIFENGQKLELPELLKAAKKGSKAVRLDDGTYGILPAEWLEKFTALVEIGESDDERVRFRQQQAMLMQALLDDQVKDQDGKYQQVLSRLSAEAQSTLPVSSPPDWFTASLRPYQQIALDWMVSLEQKGLSGILADDMGLGKTVEVLSLLARRHEAKPQFPSLVVLPSSLIFNWSNEAAKFAPRLKVGCYYGASRRAEQMWFNQYDIVFTTYGTMRQDAYRLASLHFDYIILDESQAIKNCDSATAKAACALRGEHRLAMTGTPVENHLAELFSQLTFLNPGLFSKRFTEALGQENSVLHSRETAIRLHKAVAPFFLRRRKEQVAPELPPKTEQILWCELDDEQRAQYDHLKEFYRQELSGNGSETANMLGALLRLRQAACHLALINENFIGATSSKLALLHEHLAALLDSGHKALVFSQFTTLLKLVAQDLDASGWKHCYLDGETKDRGEVVRKFQEDASVGIFLISLKAGGVGLNLTAADYVYLLDPWWNPAAEAQAIDRTYRIGQTRPVFAYRMIAKDTVEEKVLQMQQRKQRLATAALGSPMEAPANITADDLRELLK